MPSKDKLKMVPRRPGLPPINVSTPAVQIDSPITVKMDMAEIAKAVNQLAGVMTQLAKQQEAILKAMETHQQTLGVLAARDANIKMPEIKIPEVKIPPRPNAFEVQIQRPGEEATTMRVQAAKTH